MPAPYVTEKVFVDPGDGTKIATDRPVQLGEPVPGPIPGTSLERYLRTDSTVGQTMVYGPDAFRAMVEWAKHPESIRAREEWLRLAQLAIQLADRAEKAEAAQDIVAVARELRAQTGPAVSEQVPLTWQAVAAALGCSSRTARRWAAEAQLVPPGVGRQLRADQLAALRAFARTRRGRKTVKR